MLHLVMLSVYGADVHIFCFCALQLTLSVGRFKDESSSNAFTILHSLLRCATEHGFKYVTSLHKHMREWTEVCDQAAETRPGCLHEEKYER